jgi:hypothetical protein
MTEPLEQRLLFAAVVYSASGANAAELGPAVAQFRAALSRPGGTGTANRSGWPAADGYRDITWENAYLRTDIPSDFPGDFFKNTEAQGCRCPLPERGCGSASGLCTTTSRRSILRTLPSFALSASGGCSAHWGAR